MHAEINALLDQVLDLVDGLGKDNWDELGTFIAEWANERAEPHPDNDGGDDDLPPDGPVDLGKAILFRHGQIHDDVEMQMAASNFMDY